MKISIIGNGNVAQSLADIFYEKGHSIHEMFAPNQIDLSVFCKRLSAKPLTTLKEISTHVDFIIIAVSDDALSNVIKEIPKGNYTIMHTSGSVSMEVFKNMGVSDYGVFYPLYSFKKGRKEDFERIPILIEASNIKTHQKIKSLAQSISKKNYDVSAEQRKIYHLSGVIINNFTNHLWAKTQELLKNNNLDFEILKPILKETSELALSTENLHQIQTGPAQRNDISIIEKHKALLSQEKDLKLIYELMSRSISNSKNNEV